MKIAIIGAGNMGYAFAALCIEKQLVERAGLARIERSAERRAFIEQKLQCGVSEAFSAAAGADVVLLAVKPQDMPESCAALRSVLSAKSVVLSIMAGIPVAALRHALGGHDKIVRCMPNTPLQIGKGMTVWHAGGVLSDLEYGRIEALLAAGGACLRVEREELLDAATALSGSGPGYVFYFFEALLEAAAELGLPPADAKLLIAQTFDGATELWRRSDAAPGELRRRVTSKGGTTAAAVAVFDDYRVRDALRAAVLRARDRSHELSRELTRRV